MAAASADAYVVAPAAAVHTAWPTAAAAGELGAQLRTVIAAVVDLPAYAAGAVAPGFGTFAVAVAVAGAAAAAAAVEPAVLREAPAFVLVCEPHCPVESCVVEPRLLQRLAMDAGLVPAAMHLQRFAAALPAVPGSPC